MKIRLTSKESLVHVALMTLAFALSIQVTLGQIAVEAWVQRYNGPGSTNDVARAISVDGSGSVFVTGYSASTNLYPFNYDYATIKYSGAGAPLWTNRYDRPGSLIDQALAVAVDGSGNVFVTGVSAVLGHPAAAPIGDYVTIAYSGMGVPLWTNSYNGPGNSDDRPTAIAVDGNGNVFVTGSSAGSDRSYDDYATIKYSGAGVPLWTNRYNGPGNPFDVASALAVDGSGNVIVTGSSGFSDYAYATIKYSDAGVPLWTNRYSGPGNFDAAYAVAVDGRGNVFVTGGSYGSGGAYSDYATIAYSGAGVPLWINRYDGPGNYADWGKSVAVDGRGNVFVTGYSYDDGSVYPDYATIAYSGAGVPLWTNRYDGPGHTDDRATAVAVDGGGNVFVTGISDGDYVTIKYSGAGAPVWTNRYKGPGIGFDPASAMTVDGSGNVFLAVISGQDYVTIKYVDVWPITLRSATLTNGIFNSSFTNTPGAPFTLLATTNLSLPSSNWMVLGGIPEIAPGQFTFADPQMTNSPQRFYRVRSP